MDTNELQRQLAELTKERDAWRDMALKLVQLMPVPVLREPVWIAPQPPIVIQPLPYHLWPHDVTITTGTHRDIQ